MAWLRRFLNHRLLMCIIFGISSGLPLVAAGGTLQAWMKNEGIDIKTIGLFSLVGLPYSYKFIWSPFMDRFSVGQIGRRRGWMLLTQAVLVLLFLFIAQLNPRDNLTLISMIAVVTAFFSASQDIVLDAYRRDILKDAELGLGSSLFVAGYRIGLLIGGAFALWFSSLVPWSTVYIFLASWIVVGMCATIISPEPELTEAPPRSLRDSVVLPLAQFFKRSHAIEILFFVLCYKLGDTLAAAMSSIFILDLGFSNADLGLIGKTFGLTAAIAGGILGGSLIPKLGLYKALWLFGIIQMIGILPFSYLASVGLNHSALAFAISVENLTSGMGTAAFLAFLAKLCDRRYSATQYALLTSLVALPRTLLASGSGYVAEASGWYYYFIFCTLMSLPGLLLLLKARRWEREQFSTT